MNINISGKTAILTGSSDCIGQSYARTMADVGESVVLVARQADALVKAEDEIRAGVVRAAET